MASLMTGVFTPTGSMLEPRYFHNSVGIGDLGVLVIAGEGPGEASGPRFDNWRLAHPVAHRPPASWPAWSSTTKRQGSGRRSRRFRFPAVPVRLWFCSRALCC